MTHRWTTRERDIVASMLRANCTAEIISRAIGGVSRASVISFVRRDPGLAAIGFTEPKKHTPDKRKQRQSKSWQEQRLANEREVSARKKAAGLTYLAGRGAQAHRDWLRQIPLMPADTRNLTARICGDPLPGRSALDRRSHSG